MLLLSNLKHRLRIAMIRASNNHKPLDQIMLIILTHSHTLGPQILQCTINNLDTTLHNEFPRIQLCLCLLYQEQGLGNLRVISHLHDFHLVDVDAANLSTLLKKLSHVMSNE